MRRLGSDLLLALVVSAPGVLGAFILAAPNLSTDPTRVDLIFASVTRAEAFRISAVLLLVSGIGAFVRALAVRVLREALSASHDRLRLVRVALATTTGAELQALLETRLGWASDGRATLFLPDGSTFVVAARYSPRITFRDEREVQTTSAGCLAKAWELGEATAADLPDATVDPAAWEEVMTSRWGVQMEQVRQLIMKPRLIVAVRIDAEGPPRQELGVVVVETDRLSDGPKDGRILHPPRVIQTVRADRERYLAVLRGTLDLDRIDNSALGRVRRWAERLAGVPG